MVQFFGERGYARLILQTIGAGQHAGTDFNDHSVRRCGNFLTNQIGHRCTVREE